MSAKPASISSTSRGSALSSHLVPVVTNEAAIQSLTSTSSARTDHFPTPPVYHGPSGCGAAAAVVPDGAALSALVPLAPVPARHQNNLLSHVVTFDVDEPLAVVDVGAAGSYGGGGAAALAMYAHHCASTCRMFLDQFHRVGLQLSEVTVCQIAMERFASAEGEHRRKCREQRAVEREERRRREEQEIAERRHREAMAAAQKEKNWRVKVEKIQEQSFDYIATSTFASLIVQLALGVYYHGSQLLSTGKIDDLLAKLMEGQCPFHVPEAAIATAGGESWADYLVGSIGSKVLYYSQYSTAAFSNLSCIFYTMLLSSIALAVVLCFFMAPAVPAPAKVVAVIGGLIHHLTAWQVWVGLSIVYYLAGCAYVWWTCRSFKGRHRASAAPPTPQAMHGLYDDVDDAVTIACSLPPLAIVLGGVVVMLVQG